MDKIIEWIKSNFLIQDDKTAILLFIVVCVVLVGMIALIISFIVHSCRKKRNESSVIENEKNVEVIKEKIGEKDIEKIVDAPHDEAKDEAVEETLIKESDEHVDKLSENCVSKEENIKNEENIMNKKESEVVKKQEPQEIVFSSNDELAFKPTIKGKYEVFHIDDFYLYRLKASNGEILVLSEIYTSEKGALNAIETLKRNLKTGTISICEDKHGLFQFKLQAANKRVLAASANYTTLQSCESAAKSFVRFAAVSPIVELEEDSDHLLEEIQLEAMPSKKGGKIMIVIEEDAYQFKFCASNGVVLCSSLKYSSKSVLMQSLLTFKEAVLRGKFLIIKDKNKVYQFKLYTATGRCIVIGEAYKNKAQVISAANSISAFLNLAEVVDKTTLEKSTI